MSAKHTARPAVRPTRPASGTETQRSCNGSLAAAATLLGAFILWTLAVCTIDIRPIGPGGSRVGFASINTAFHQLTSENLISCVAGTSPQEGCTFPVYGRS